MASILIVEDERVSAEEIASMVRAAGHDVAGIAASAEPALDLAARLAPDLALVDVKLRGAVDGIALADRLQGQLDIPVIYITGRYDEASRTRAIRSATYGYLLKPVDGRTLETSVEMAIARRERDRSLRLGALATLAAGIAHDLNNSLAVVVNSAARARAALAPGADASASLDELDRAADRAKGLTMQLTAFAGGGSFVRRPVDLSPLIRRSVAAALERSSMQSEFDIADDLWPVHADEAQLAQALTNLALAGRDALRGAGKLSIVAKNRELDQHESLLPPGRYASLAIAHEGARPPGDLQRLFDPFFATGPEGAGLGLASAHAIVARHGGQLRAEPGTSGVVFSALLPAEPAAKAQPSRARAGARRARTDRILVMDDEEPLRRILSLCLRDAGYRVEQAGDGSEAVQKYAAAQADGQPFDAVILDLTVARGMGGVDAVAHLRRLDPEVRAIAASGYSASPVLDEFERFGFAGALAKPFHFTILVNLLRQVTAEAK